MTIGAILHGRTGPVISARKEDTVRAVLDLLAQHIIDTNLKGATGADKFCFNLVY